MRVTLWITTAIHLDTHLGKSGTGFSSVSGFPRAWLMIRLPCASFFHAFQWPGAARASQVRNATLHAYHAPKWTPADPYGPYLHRSSRMGFWYVNTIAICINRSNGAVSSFRECGLPVRCTQTGLLYGLCGSLCTLQLCRSALHLYLLHSCNIQYEWLVKPYSAGTLALQEAPSFAWRTNA